MNMYVLLSEDGDGNFDTFCGVFPSLEGAVEYAHKELEETLVYKMYGEMIVRKALYHDKEGNLHESEKNYELGFLYPNARVSVGNYFSIYFVAQSVEVDTPQEKITSKEDTIAILEMAIGFIDVILKDESMLHFAEEDLIDAWNLETYLLIRQEALQEVLNIMKGRIQ